MQSAKSEFIPKSYNQPIGLERKINSLFAVLDIFSVGINKPNICGGVASFVLNMETYCINCYLTVI